MIRVKIRNRNSDKPTKPRVFDILIEDDGKIFFESKVNGCTEVVSLTDVMKQIEEARTSY